MGFSKTIYSIIGVLVAIIMIATVAMPAIENASTTTTTTTTTEIQDIEVSDPIYYKPYSSIVRVIYSDENVPVIQQYYDSAWTGYTLDSDFTNIPIFVSDKAVYILSQIDNRYYMRSSGFAVAVEALSTSHELTEGISFEFEFIDGVFQCKRYYTGGIALSEYIMPTWNYIVSIPEYGGDYVTSVSQDVVTLKSLNEIVAGSARMLDQDGLNFAYIYDGEQTQYGDFALTINSVQTDAGVDVSLKASYGDTEVLILVPTTTEITVTQTITVQSEYGPILNVVLLMLLIVPVTAVAAMLYTRRD